MSSHQAAINAYHTGLGVVCSASVPADADQHRQTTQSNER
jgi:hypothetical protein